MGGLVQRSGRERVAVGFAKRKRAEADGREQGRRCPGPAKRTERRWDRPRCPEIGWNVSMNAAKRMGEGLCWLRRARGISNVAKV